MLIQHTGLVCVLEALSVFLPPPAPSSSCLFKSRPGGTVPEGISLWNVKSTLLRVHVGAQSPRCDSSAAEQQQRECTAVAGSIAFHRWLMAARAHGSQVSRSCYFQLQERPDSSKKVSPSRLEACQSSLLCSLRRQRGLLTASFSSLLVSLNFSLPRLLSYSVSQGGRSYFDSAHFSMSNHTSVWISLFQAQSVIFSTFNSCYTN